MLFSNAMSMSSWKISRKLLLTPATFTIAMIVLAAVSSFGVQDARNSAEFLFKNTASRISDGLSVEKGISDINGSLFRMLSWSNSGMEAGKIADLAKSLSKKIDDIKPAFVRILEAYDFSPDERATADAILPLVDSYVTAAKDVLDMIEVDVSSSVVMVSQAANETGEAAGQILSAASELSKHSEVLKTEVDKFLADVRAA